MKKKITAIALIVAMLAIAVVGGSLAYFTDEDDAQNTFAVGNVSIKLDEAPVTYDSDTYLWTADMAAERVQANDYENLYPGAVLPKDPTVHNTGSMDAYVRVKVTVTGYQYWVKLVSLKGTNQPNSQEYLTLLVDQLGEGWTVTDIKGNLPGGDIEYTLTYAGVLPAGESTTPVFTNVVIPTNFGDRNGYDSQDRVRSLMGIDKAFNINVVAEAIQAPTFADADAAWAAFDA